MKRIINRKISINDNADNLTLAESEERFKIIFENSPVGKSITGIDGSLEVNKAFCDILGYNEEELKNKNWKEITHPDDIKESQEVVDSLINGGKKNLRYEKRYIHKNGSIVWTDISTSLQRDESGVPRYFITIIIDITSLKESTKKLKKSEERYKSYIELTGQIAWVANPDGEVIEDIPSFRKFTGQTYNEVRGTGWASALHADDVEPTMKLWADAVSTKSSYETEYRLRRYDGEYRYFLAKGSPVLNVVGEITEWVGVCIDITERKQTEIILQDDQERIKTILDLVGDPIFVKDNDHRITLANSAFMDIFCLDENSVIGKTLVEAVPENERKHFLAVDRRVLDTGIPDLQEEELTVKGFTRTIITRKASFIDKFGKKFLVGSIHDITDRKLAEEAVKKANENLERSNQELEQFAYVASHDLQEPLRMVSSYTQLLERRYKDQLDQDANDFIFFAVDGANRMQHLINDLLDYSRVTSRGKPFVKLDLSDVLGHALANLQKRVQETKALIVNDDLPFVYGDEVQLVRVFQNLLDNAMKFRGTDPPMIKIKTETLENEIQISISDNGIGIDEIYADRVFTIFQRLHTKEEYSGTGIGLAICKRTIERHGGRIWFKSDPGKGTTFYFTLTFK
jgi:PAS domain S-box-containing protein